MKERRVGPDIVGTNSDLIISPSTGESEDLLSDAQIWQNQRFGKILPKEFKLLLLHLAVCCGLAEFHLLDAFRHGRLEVEILKFATEAPGIQLRHELRLVFRGDVVNHEATWKGRRVGFHP